MPETRTRKRTSSRNRYGIYGKHLEIFEMFESWRDDPEAQQALAEEMGWVEEGEDLAEASGSGSPEGRADFPLFLLSTVRHRMRAAFRRRAARWDRYMGVERAEDFRVHTVSQLNGITGMAEIPEYGEYGRLRSDEEEGPPYAVGKHGGVYGITLEMIVNDDANLILNRTPTELGRMSAAYVSRVAVALVESNPDYIDGLPFFTSTPRSGLPTGNESTGAAAIPSSDNLTTILSNMRNTEDSEGFPIDIEPRWVLTKDERTRLIFKMILRSQQTGATSNDTGAETIDKGRLNPLYDDALLPGDSVIVEPYLKDPNDWIVLADTGRPAFVIAFLRDRREPFIGIKHSGVTSVGGGSEDPYSMDYDEVEFKIRHIFGVALGDPRSAHRARRA
jgi:hypothetical protein